MSEAAAQKVKKPAKPAEHPKYSDMVVAALAALKERNGSSRQAIEKYIKANNKVGENCRTHLKLALKRMCGDKGTLIHTKGKGASGSFKINKADVEKKPKKAVKKPTAKKATAKTAAAKKSAAKKPAAKKPAAKKPAAKKATKKPAAKSSTKKPAAKKGAKKPAAKAAKAAAKKPAAKKPAAKGKGKSKKSSKSPAKSPKK